MACSTNEIIYSDEQLRKDLEKIRSCHDEAFLYISQGLSYEEQSEFVLARTMYESGLEKINSALSINCNRPQCTGPKWDNARKMQQKMQKTMHMINGQLQTLSTTNVLPSNNAVLPEAPPSYEEACRQDSFAASRRFSMPPDISKLDVQNGNDNTTDVIELFCIPNNVQIFYISPNGPVNTSSEYNSLHIYKFENVENQDITCPAAWLQVGSWTYPLIPGQSPALESGYGAFLFPDVGKGEGSSVGLILPSSVNLNQRMKFVSLLSELTALEDEKSLLKEKTSDQQLEVGRGESYSDTVSRGIVIGAEYLSAGLVKGASVAGNLIHKGATKVRDRISPESQPVTVDPLVREGLKVARDASGVVLKASGFLVKKLGELTVALGKQIAPHVRQQGTKVLETAFKNDTNKAKDTMDGVLKIAAGGLVGFSTVYMGLEQAARTLAYSLSSETVNIVGHKYGQEAGEVVNNAVYAVGNLALTTHNVHSLGVKSVAKRTAKDAGKAVLKDYVEEIDKSDKQ